MGGGASEASHVPLRPQFPGDECEDGVRIAPAGSVPLRSPLVPPVKDCVLGRHPLGRVHNIADVAPNLFSERVGDVDVVDGFSFLVAEEAKFVCLESVALSSVGRPVPLHQCQQQEQLDSKGSPSVLD